MAAGKKINIIYIIDGLGMGGAERLMIPILKNLDREIFTPRVCVLQNKDGNPIAEELRNLGIQVDLLPISYLRDIGSLARLRKYLREAHADIVHTQLEFANILGGLAAKSLGLPCVSTIHTIPSHETRRKMKLHNALEMLSLRMWFDRIIAVSQETRQYHITLGGLNPARVQTIYNGIELSHYTQSVEQTQQACAAIRSELNIPNTAQVITTVAVLRELKGIQFMIRAMPQILKEHPNTYYLVVGDGAYRENLVKEVKDQAVQSRVLFTGRRSDIPQILQASDIFVLPTLTEALPTVLAEAMGARLPIVACAVGGVPEMIVDGVNGRLIPSESPMALAEACIELLGTPLKAKQMGEEGCQLADQKFHIQTQVQNLKTLYINLMSNL